MSCSFIGGYCEFESSDLMCAGKSTVWCRNQRDKLEKLFKERGVNMNTLNEIFRKVILANELENNLDFVHRFSDPDGVRSGKSGWSFGVSQFDTQNNEQAIMCLRACGFTEGQIKGIVDQTIDVKPLAVQLKAHSDIIAKYDAQQLSYCLNKALNFNVDYGIPVLNTAAILAGADYVNQYGSQGQGAVSFYKSLGRPITAEDILSFKLTVTKYGKEHPSDCKRRYKNLMQIVQEEGL